MPKTNMGQYVFLFKSCLLLHSVCVNMCKYAIKMEIVFTWMGITKDFKTRDYLSYFNRIALCNQASLSLKSFEHD